MSPVRALEYDDRYSPSNLAPHSPPGGSEEYVPGTKRTVEHLQCELSGVEGIYSSLPTPDPLLLDLQINGTRLAWQTASPGWAKRDLYKLDTINGRELVFCVLDRKARNRLR